jgi:hypothetical protein
MAAIKQIFSLCELPPIGIDSCGFILGEFIGKGAYREVYNFPFKSNTVIKVAKDSYANILEWEIWKSVKGTPNEKWFCPCLYMSREGYFLIQPKCKPLKDSDKLPKNLPAFFDDVRRNNWGWYKGNLVCFDYQFIQKGIDYAMNVRVKNILK